MIYKKKKKKRERERKTERQIYRERDIMAQTDRHIDYFCRLFTNLEITSLAVSKSQTSSLLVDLAERALTARCTSSSTLILHSRNISAEHAPMDDALESLRVCDLELWKLKRLGFRIGRECAILLVNI